MTESSMSGDLSSEEEAGPFSFPITWPWPQLYAYPSFQIQVNHPAREIRVSGFVGNKQRYSAPKRNVWVAVGVSVRIRGVLISTQKVYHMGLGLRGGDVIKTPTPVVADLAYFNEDNGARYTFETLVDFDFDVVDFARADNHYQYEWWATAPGSLRDGAVFTFKDGLLQPDATDAKE